MKYLNLVLVSLFCLTINAQSFVTTGKTWLITECYADSSGGGGDPQCNDYEYSFGEAIELDGQVYLTLVTDNDSELYYHAYYREEGGRVYARNNETDEFLLYDFNLEEGDMVTAGNPNSSSLNYTDFTVTEVEFIELEDGSMTKQLKVQNPLGATFRWIQGVGSMDNTFAPGTEWADDYSWHWFKCVLIHDELYYSESSSCSFVGIEKEENRFLQISPNPTSGVFNISTANDVFLVGKTLYVYSVAGSLIMTKDLEESISIDLSALYRGVYIVEIVSEDRRFYGKLIKE